MEASDRTTRLRASPPNRLRRTAASIRDDIGLTFGGTAKRLLVPRFDIDMTECMFCNLCTYPCPEDCIFMTGGPNSEKQPLDYEYSQYDKKNLIFEFATLTKKDIKKFTTPPPPQQEILQND